MVINISAIRWTISIQLKRGKEKNDYYYGIYSGYEANTIFPSFLAIPSANKDDIYTISVSTWKGKQTSCILSFTNAFSLDPFLFFSSNQTWASSFFYFKIVKTKSIYPKVEKLDFLNKRSRYRSS